MTIGFKWKPPSLFGGFYGFIAKREDVAIPIKYIGITPIGHCYIDEVVENGTRMRTASKMKVV